MGRLHRVHMVFDRNVLEVKLDRQNWTTRIVSVTTSLRLRGPVVVAAVAADAVGAGGNL